MKVRGWYRFQNAASDPTVAEIHIIDVIGDWMDDMINEYYGMTATVTAKAFVDQLSKLPDAVTAIKVHINSPGGDVFAALNIANALRQQQAQGRSVETIVDGLAASAASIVMMAGSKVTIADNAMVMVHNPWSVAVGNSADMRKSADTLDAIRNTIVATYKWHSSLDDDAIVALLDAETWMDADAAVSNGFATDKIDGLRAAASIDAKAISKMNVPERFKARLASLVKPADVAPTPAPATDVMNRVAAAGLGLDLATVLVSAALPMEQVTLRIETAKAAKATAQARVDEIRALGAKAKQPELAETFIAEGLSVNGARAALVSVTAQIDSATPIDNSLLPETGNSKGRVKIDTAGVYAQRNAAHAARNK